MIVGMVNDDNEPVFDWWLAGEVWTAVIDTGFNGELELPDDLFERLRPVRAGVEWFELAGGRRVRETMWTTIVSFDDNITPVTVSFAPVQTILVGTDFLRDYRLEIDFVARTVRLERVKL